MSTINYNHNQNLHSLEGPQKAIPYFFRDHFPKSILDVGCGTGTWLRAALDLGVSDVYGLDGVDIEPEDLLIPKKYFKCCDLTSPIDLGRKFATAICFEVAEHLEPKHAGNLIEILTRHADRVIFSAACPGQPGQHHVNCQWPDYWQNIFNSLGYACDDSIRWEIWSNTEIEWWYRQNMFTATLTPDFAGRERRIPRVVHPELEAKLLESRKSAFEAGFSRGIDAVKHGSLPASEYLCIPPMALFHKIKRMGLKSH